MRQLRLSGLMFIFSALIACSMGSTKLAEAPQYKTDDYSDYHIGVGDELALGSTSGSRAASDAGGDENAAPDTVQLHRGGSAGLEHHGERTAGGTARRDLVECTGPCKRRSNWRCNLQWKAQTSRLFLYRSAG